MPSTGLDTMPLPGEPRPRVLALTSLYPNPFRPGWAVFNQRQMRALAGLCPLALVAPIPFTQAWPSRGKRAAMAVEPFPVLRPWFIYPPGVLRAWQGRCYLLSAWPALRRLAADLRPQVLYATWLYPDAWAGMLAARRLGLPLAMRLHGSDLLVQGRDPARLPRLRQVLTAAQAVIAPSASLAQAAREMGAPAERVWVAPNGVDTEMFKPADRSEARRELGLPEGPLLLFLGRLEAVKGPGVALEALTRLPRAALVVVGDGSLGPSLRTRAATLGLAGRVLWAGGQPADRVARYLAAADALVLPSLSEGEPNAVLEALASGRPVAASAVGGVPALVQDGVSGALAPAGDAPALAEAMARVLGRAWDPQALAGRVAGRSWPASAGVILDALRAAIDLGAGA